MEIVGCYAWSPGKLLALQPEWVDHTPMWPNVDLYGEPGGVPFPAPNPRAVCNKIGRVQISKRCLSPAAK